MHPRSSHQCNWITKISCLCLPDLSAAFDTIDHDILITRLSSWLCLQVIPVFPLFPCSMQQQPFLLPHFLMWHSSKFCPRSYTFHHVHHPTKYSHLNRSTTTSMQMTRSFSSLDYCNSLYYNFPNSQLSRLEHIQNSLAPIARAVVKVPKLSHTTPILKYIHLYFAKWQ